MTKAPTPSSSEVSTSPLWRFSSGVEVRGRFMALLVASPVPSAAVLLFRRVFEANHSSLPAAARRAKPGLDGAGRDGKGAPKRILE